MKDILVTLGMLAMSSTVIAKMSPASLCGAPLTFRVPYSDATFSLTSVCVDQTEAAYIAEVLIPGRSVLIDTREVFPDPNINMMQVYRELSKISSGGKLRMRQIDMIAGPVRNRLLRGGSLEPARLALLRTFSFSVPILQQEQGQRE